MRRTLGKANRFSQLYSEEESLNMKYNSTNSKRV